MNTTLTFDAAPSQRETDENGFLHVGASHITKATVNPYYGREIPGWQEAGLDPEAEKPLGHLTDAVVHLAGGHVMPLPRLIVLPLGDEVIGVAFATLGEQ